MDSASSGLSRFPDLESNLDSLRIRIAYRISERIELAVRLKYEKFKAEDWALQDVGPATIPVILTLGANPYDSDVFMFGLGFRYLFGGTSAELSAD